MESGAGTQAQAIRFWSPALICKILSEGDQGKHRHGKDSEGREQGNARPFAGSYGGWGKRAERDPASGQWHFELGLDIQAWDQARGARLELGDEEGMEASGWEHSRAAGAGTSPKRIRDGTRHACYTAGRGSRAGTARVQWRGGHSGQEERWAQVMFTCIWCRIESQLRTDIPSLLLTPLNSAGNPPPNLAERLHFKFVISERPQ